MKGDGSGDKGTTNEETSGSESNQGPCNQESSKKDDILTMETTSDTEGGFIEEVNIPLENRLHRIRIEAPIFCSFLHLETHSLNIFNVVSIKF